jgi:hypothetical protein
MKFGKYRCGRFGFIKAVKMQAGGSSIKEFAALAGGKLNASLKGRFFIVLDRLKNFF